MDEGGFDGGMDSGGFDGGMDSGGFDGGMDSGGFDGDMDSGGFDGDMDSGGFDGDMDSGGFDGDMDSGGFDGGMDSGGFDGDMDSGGFDGGMDSGGFDGDMDSGGFDGGMDSGGFDGDMDSGGFDGDMDFDSYEGEMDSDSYDGDLDADSNEGDLESDSFEEDLDTDVDFDSYEDGEFDTSADSDVIPLESLDEAAEPMVDSDDLFEPLPAEFDDVQTEDVPADSDVIPLESLDEAAEPMVDSDDLFEPLPAEFDDVQTEDIPADSDAADEIAEAEQPAETTEKPDYSYHWTGYETHEMPEPDHPKVLSRGYSTTPDETFHPGSWDLEQEAYDVPEEPETFDLPDETAPLETPGSMEYVDPDSLPIDLVESGPEEISLEAETAEFDFPETDVQESGNLERTREIAEALEAGYDDYRDHEIRSMAQEVRDFRTPKETTDEGIARGRWEADSFILDDDFVPTEFNPEHKTISEIRNDLHERYGLELGEIPYRDGEADFSGISVVNLDADDIVSARLGMDVSAWKGLPESDRLEKMSEVFDKRNANFAVADQLAAERGIEIPTLGSNYTQKELADWRRDNHFTWDEQVGGGYRLVPSVIHGNVAHTGLVSSAANAQRTLSDYREHSRDYTWDEADAPISVQEVLDKSKR